MSDRIGRQTPTQSVVLPYSESRGSEAIEIYNSTDRTAIEWQELLCYDIMAVNDDGLWVHQKFGYSVSRRNGKSEDVLMRCAWGLKNGEKILYTAHRTTTAHAIWERLEYICNKAGIIVESSFKAFGKEHLHCAGGGKIEFRTRTSSGGLGEGYDLLIIDEAQEYTDNQETALKYVVSDSLNPQTIMLGTPPTTVSAGTVFMKFRESVLAGESVDCGWAEWSVETLTDVNDVDAWYETNPSMGFHLNERKIRAEISGDDLDFNIQRLGLWIRYNIKSAISEQEWMELKVDKLPKLKGELFAGVKFGIDGVNTALSIAVHTDDDRVFVESIDCRSQKDGTDWICDFIRRAGIRRVVVDGANGRETFAKEMKDYGLRKPVIPNTAEIIVANNLFEQSVFAKQICHAGQPSLVNIVSNCEHRAIGSNGGFGYKSIEIGADIALMDSMILAHWQCKEKKLTHKQRITY